jgi:tetratricopeptide (TPR) repeat protein
VGRVAPNDVVIPDESVSISHAVFKRIAGDRFIVQDSGSKNGTFLNEARVPHKGDERALEVKSNNMVRFGSVVLTFLLPPEVYDLARTLGAIAGAVERPVVPQSKSLSAEELFSDLSPRRTGTTPLSDRLLSYFDAVQHVRNKRYRSAQIMLKELLAAEPNNKNARIWLLLAEAREMRRAGKRAEAAAKYQAVLELDSTHEEARRAVGKVS